MAPLFFSLCNIFLQYSFLLFSFWYLLCHSSGSQHPYCNDGDRSSLLHFKQSFVFDKFSCDPSTDYTKLSSWNVAHDCCSWDGVHCDHRTGHVVGLDLSSSCLFGSINSINPLFRLLHLTSLNLSHNDFNLSTIPEGIRGLSKLKHLNLSSSNIFGLIPSQILELSNLISLDFSQNTLVLHKPGLEGVVEKLTRLVELDLSGVNISSHVPQSLSTLTSLSSLLLENCSLQGEFPSGIFQLPKLRVLNLQYNLDLTGYLPELQVGNPLEEMWLEGTNFSGQLPLSIGNLKSLRIFSASECCFRGLIPSSIGNLTKLNILILSENYFSGKIPSSFSNLRQLAYLSLSYNNFSSSTLDWVSKLTSLESLHLVETNSYGLIPASLGNLTQLRSVWLHTNQLTGPIPSWVGNLTQLFRLQIGENQLNGRIPESIFKLPNLQDLYLTMNNLSGTLKFDSFFQMKHLSQLQISNNQLSLVSNTYTNVTAPQFQILGLGGCNLREFPRFLRGQTKLEYLRLSENKIKGYVPNWMFTMESLNFLRLEYNSLTGFEHPLGVLPWTNLFILNLSFNKFEGPLPIPPPSVVIYDVSQNKFNGEISPSFCDLTSVLALDLSDNNLSGNLPSCLGHLANVASVLNLRKNRLSGKIPDRFTARCSLTLMDFSQNKFEGNVPRSLANCSKLEIINLEENKVNDVFPYWLGIIPSLRILSLKSNKLQGTIGQPLTESEFDKLQIIDLSNNNFTGKLPLEYFRNWVAMKSVDNDHLAYMQAHTSFEIPGYAWSLNYNYSIRIVNKGTERQFDKILEFFVVVDLSSNRFEGVIPEIIGTLRELQSLNLSNNLFTGQIPSSLGNLTKLEALDLSLNNLSGEIPTQLAFLTFLAVFNVSHNSLQGSVPRGNQFDTFGSNSFLENPGLCGDQLSRKCGNTKTLSLPPSEDENEDGKSPFELNWEIVMMGFGSGLVIGVAYGYAMDTGKYEWLVRKKFARWRRN